jgi:hypothetical protein
MSKPRKKSESVPPLIVRAMLPDFLLKIYLTKSNSPTTP